jgi:hypothetical protein
LLSSRTSSSFMPQVTDSETMKFFIMSQSLSLSLMGYVWLAQDFSRSLSN